MRQALAFLTPLGGASVPGPRALRWFPVVGAATGLLLGAIWWGVAQVVPPGVAAGIVLAGDLALTGMLHMDGLLDTADGLFLHGAAERRLEVMRDSAVGAFGVSAAVAVLVLRWAALDALAPEVLVLAGIWSTSRALMGFSAGYVPYARASGIASAFLGQGIDMAGQGIDMPAEGDEVPQATQATQASLPNAEPVASARACARACGLAGLALGIPFTLAGAAWPFEGTGAALLAHLSGALAALLLGVAAGAGVVLLARRRLGGFTGDVLGAAGVVTETVALVVLGARW